MIDSPLNARNEMAAMLASGWALADWAGMGIGAAPFIAWEGRDNPHPPNNSKPYAAFFVRHAAGFQDSLAGATGKRKWARVGTLVVQCFGSLSGSRGLEDATNMATIAQRIYQGKQSENCIWFRDVTVKEVGPSGGWYQMNLTAAFEYDELR